MVDTKFYWAERVPKGIGSDHKLYNISSHTLRNSFGNYLINPFNRSNSGKIPKLLKNIQKNTEAESAGKATAWNEDKKQYFEDTAKSAYKSLLEADLVGLVDEFFPKGSKGEDEVLWKGNLHLDNEDARIKLNDFKQSSNVKEFTGEGKSFGESDITAKQKKLLKGNRLLTQEEFFDRSAWDEQFSVNFVKGSRIEVKLIVDHSQGDVGKKIFRDAWPKGKILIESDPTAKESTKIYNYSREMGDVKGLSRKGAPKDPTNVWFKTGKEPQKIDSKKNPKAGQPKDTEAQEKEVERFAGRWQEALKKPQGKETQEQFESRVERQEEEGFPSKHFKNWRRTQQLAGETVVAQIDEENSIDIDEEDAQDIWRAISEFFENDKKHSEEIEKVFENLLEDTGHANLFDFIKRKLTLLPQYFRKYIITFTLSKPKIMKERGLFDGTLWIPTIIDVESNKKIDLTQLEGLAREEMEPETIYKPKGTIRAEPVKDIEPEVGFNEARAHLANQITNGMKFLEQAAPYLKGG